MSLNLNDRVSSASGAYCTAPEYTDAVNDSQFVRTFGGVALAGSILAFISGAVAIGIGMAVLGFGRTQYYRILGIATIALGVASIMLAPFAFLAPIVLSGGIAFKAFDILGTLSSVGKDDPDWQDTRKRAITGLALSAIGFVLSGGLLLLFLLRVTGMI
ncbi:MAG TPA: hypothetical protein VF762_11455 [Blastocatellia bacterium]|jgi:chromate transport protein ChrA